jgi:hypothetical protein
MTAFIELDWGRIDVHAIVGSGGLATIEERRHAACRDWLAHQDYEFDVLDCRPGLKSAIPALGRMLHWEREFGYVLSWENRNLNSLRDGFHFDISEGGGRVFEVNRADLAWEEDETWLLGLLAIVQEQSRRHLALGRRFFGLLVIPEASPLIGAVIQEARVPGPFWSPCREVHEFER